MNNLYKKGKLFLFLIVFSLSVTAQVNNYIFTSNPAGAYAPIAGTALGTTNNNDESFNAIPLGFNFVFNGTTYNTVSVNSNGFIAMGNSVTSSYKPIRAGSTNNIISAFGLDLRASLLIGSELSYATSGVSPNSIFTVQWRSYYSGSLNDNYSFQIKLYETSNKIEIVYGSFANSSGQKWAQVGIRGNNSGDYQNRSITQGDTWLTSAPGISNGDSCLLYGYSGHIPPSGLTFSWSLPNLDLGVTAFMEPMGCYGANQTVRVRTANFGTSTIDFSVNPVTVSANATGPNPQTFTPITVNTGTLASGATEDFTFTTTYDMSVAGTYTFQAIAKLTGDQFSSNDTLVTTRNVTFTNPSALPQAANFTGYTGANLTAIHPQWTEASGVSPTGTTSQWIASNASQQTFYGANGVTAKVGLFGNTNRAWILSPKFTATSYTKFSFKMSVTTYNGTSFSYMGSDDSLNVMISTNCGATWSRIYTANYDSLLTESFRTSTFDLSSYAGQNIIVGFYATDGNIDDPELYDFHLDDINIYNELLNDVGVSVLLSPMDGLCANTNNIVKVVVTNYGSNSQTNIPVVVDITGPGSAVLYDTVRVVLQSLQKDTLSFPVSFTPTSGGTYNFRAYTTLAGDNIINNDTLIAQRVFNSVTSPIVSDTTICGPDSVALTASGPGMINWYDSAAAGNLLATGPNYTTPVLTQTTSYYVENRDPFNSTITTGFNGANSYSGNMFDIKVNNSFTIDSFDVNINAGANVIKVYYKTGSYVGFENDAAAWTFVDSVNVIGNGQGIPTRAAIGGLTLLAGQTYGIYITTVNGGIWYFRTADTIKVSDANMTLSLGISNAYPFTDKVFPRAWDGTIYYTAACISPRAPLTVTVDSLPTAVISGTQTICQGASATITLAPTLGTIQWQDSPDSSTFTNITGETMNTLIVNPTVTRYYRAVVSNGVCSPVNSNVVTITVNPNATLTLTSAPGTDNQFICQNSALTDITYSVGGGGTAASATGLPAGVTNSFSGSVLTISGTPTIAGAYTYTVMTTGGTCSQDTVTGVINVTTASSVTLTSAPGTENQTVCENIPITDITYAIGGGGPGTASGLPPGVTGTLSGTVFTISGTPTAGGIYDYTVTSAGGCNTAMATGRITVDPNATITLTSAAGTDSQTVCIDTAITNITYQIGGGGTGATASGLPAGVMGNFSGTTFTISGTPTVAGTYNYTVTTSGLSLIHI